MHKSASLAVILVFLFVLLCQLGWGVLTLQIAQMKTKKVKFKLSDAAILGILVSLHALLLLKNIGMDWLSAVLLICVVGFASLFFLRDLLNYKALTPSLNLVLWTFASLVLGTTLFTYADSQISTMWVNNYGDLTFHLGMISSFAIADIFPPQFHLFSGTDLNYPLLINFWSSAIWSFFLDYQALSVIFALQWIVLWLLVYFLLDGDENWILPWAVLLGGGSIAFLGHNSGGAPIGENKPWTIFLTTIWVTQRTTVLGLVGVLGSLNLVLRYLRQAKEGISKPSFSYMIAAGLMLGLSNIAHTHFSLAVGVFICLVFFFEFLNFISQPQGLPNSFSDSKLLYLPLMLFLAATVLSGLLGIGYFMDKTSIIKFQAGWIETGLAENHSFLSQLALSVEIWLRDTWPYLGSFLLFWIFSKKHSECLSILLLFILFNFVHAAAWWWDQIKFFISLTVILVAVWSQAKFKYKHLLQTVLLLTIIPALYELVPILADRAKFGVFEKQDVEIAEEIKQNSGENSILLASYGTHKSPVVLTGRVQLMGFEGTLWSHGLDTAEINERKTLVDNLSNLSSCLSSLSSEDCPDYLVWTRDEQEKYNLAEPGYPFEKTASKYLYKFVK